MCECVFSLWLVTKEENLVAISCRREPFFGTDCLTSAVLAVFSIFTRESPLLFPQLALSEIQCPNKRCVLKYRHFSPIDSSLKSSESSHFYS